MSWFKRFIKPVEKKVEEVVAPVEPMSVETTEEPQSPGFFKRLVSGLSKTREALSSGLAGLILGRKEIDEELLENLETLLLTADVGVEATEKILADLTARLKRQELKDPEALIQALQADLTALLVPTITR